jgi:hypothetical protein
LLSLSQWGPVLTTGDAFLVLHWKTSDENSLERFPFPECNCDQRWHAPNLISPGVIVGSLLLVVKSEQRITPTPALAHVLQLFNSEPSASRLSV